MKLIQTILNSKSIILKDSFSVKNLIFENIKLKFALKASNIGVWDYNTETETTNFSEESANILGYDVNELNANPEIWNNLVHPEDKEKYFADFKTHLEGNKKLYKNLCRVKHKDGSYRWILDNGKVLERTESGLAKRVIGVHVDITDTKNKEEQIEKSLDLITVQNKKLTNFAHIATHNLKEHAGNFESLLNFYEEAETQEEKENLIKYLKTVSLNLNNTITNLKDIVSIETSKNSDFSVIKPKEFIDNSINNLLLDVKYKNAEISNKINTNISLNFNKTYFESIVQNLLSNALKYAHPDRNPKISISAVETEKNIQILFEDNGLGIDLDAYNNDIFGLYKTFHKNKNSEGVGLYITKNQMESLGGSISVSSEVNVGSTFVLIFLK